MLYADWHSEGALSLFYLFHEFYIIQTNERLFHAREIFHRACVANLKTFQTHFVSKFRAVTLCVTHKRIGSIGYGSLTLDKSLQENQINFLKNQVHGSFAVSLSDDKSIKFFFTTDSRRCRKVLPCFHRQGKANIQSGTGLVTERNVYGYC